METLKKKNPTRKPKKEVKHYYVKSGYDYDSRSHTWKSLCGIDRGTKGPERINPPMEDRCVVCEDLRPKGDGVEL